MNPDSTESTTAKTPSNRSEYSQLIPSDHSALSLFDGSWTSRLPGHDGPGQLLLFDDVRIHWLIAQLGSIQNFRVLELGPLEGGHTWMLEQAGARVTAVEANHSAFLRCLVTKNLLGMKAKFLLGDFTRDLPKDQAWDLVVASGILYHLGSPETLIESLAPLTNSIFLWTHYFEPDASKWNSELGHKLATKWRADRTELTTCNGIEIRLVPMYYEESVGWSGFCGGPDDFGNWMYKSDILELLKSFGFTRQVTAFDQPDFVNGPSFAVLATRDPVTH